MVDTLLVPEGTKISAAGDGPAVDISGAGHRLFLLTLNITNVIEQESLDIGMFGSADGATWGSRPIDSFPQKFYRGQHPMLLDLRQQLEIRFVRAHWEVNRWGRGDTTPMFECHVTMKEVPPDVLEQARAEAKTIA